ncbi:sulfatase-like hydrolase/transferase [Agriterribacter humi]|jgi:arylsulfatase A-like enzyme|uniref:sulfatase-like hydrolase/transferase n=1 Tax=Agriterribacter humi TaxID=1104781 RepID=UPI001263F696|nr:sulfatase-like hydrolase/transferase [Agriterribacter humi]
MAEKLIITVLVFLSVFIPFKAIKAQQPVTTKPNVIVIITDDQHYRTIRALGNKEIITPNMDKLVKGGTAFTQAHIQGGLSGAICCPSRAMLLTSKNLFSLHEDGQYIPVSDITFPELFRSNGYITFETGKWHQDKGSFNRSFALGDNIFFGGMHPPATGGQYRPRLNHYDRNGLYNNPFWGDQFSSVYFADAAISFLKKQQHNPQPFLMYVAFTSPHDPRTAPSWYGHHYRMEDVSLPENYLPRHPFDNGELQIRDETLLPFPRTEEAIRKEIARYYSMISEADEQVGRILETLKKTGKDKNTIVVFAGDNGLAMGQHGLLGKQNLYDCAIRVPLIFKGPGIPAGKLINKYVYLNDIYPTLCELAGIPVPDSVEGKSMISAFGNGNFNGRDHLLFAYLNLQRAIVHRDLKLIRYNVNGQSFVQLFDLNTDPFEMHNLAEENRYRAKLMSMDSLLNKTMEEMGDFCDINKPGWGYPQKWTMSEVKKLNP